MSDVQYCVDTSAWIEAFNVSYPPIIFESLWAKMADQRDRLVVIRPNAEILHKKNCANNSRSVSVLD